MNEAWKIIKDNDAHHNSILQNGYTGCDVVVMSQFQVRNYTPGPNEVCISIGSKNWGITAPELEGRFKNLLSLEFDDVQIADANDPTAKNLTSKVAAKVIKFFADYVDNTDRVVIHCFAGISRSRSMAAALCHCFDLPFEYTVLNKPVYDVICKTYNEINGLVK
jgi:predicted protein tyrosine phosphatase